jgi:hypothetical protein
MTDDNAMHSDPDRSVYLCDVGQPDYWAAVGIAADGTEILYLHQRGTTSGRPDPRCRDVAHEQLGPLPPRWAARTALCAFRCGRTTMAGQPCRMYVSRPGDACGWHRRSKSTA